MATTAVIVLSVLVLTELLLILALARQVGRILVRLGPSGADALETSDGPAIGERMGEIEVPINGDGVLRVPQEGRRVLLAFLSLTSCDACRSLVRGTRTASGRAP